MASTSKKTNIAKSSRFGSKRLLTAMGVFVVAGALLVAYSFASTNASRITYSGSQISGGIHNGTSIALKGFTYNTSMSPSQQATASEQSSVSVTIPASQTAGLRNFCWSFTPTKMASTVGGPSSYNTMNDAMNNFANVVISPAVIANNPTMSRNFDNHTLPNYFQVGTTRQVCASYPYDTNSAMTVTLRINRDGNEGVIDSFSATGNGGWGGRATNPFTRQ